MKITYGAYQVEIKAKSVYRKNAQYNNDDTEAVLYDIICALNDAAIFNDGQGYKNIARSNSDKANSLYCQLKGLE